MKHSKEVMTALNALLSQAQAGDEIAMNKYLSMLHRLFSEYVIEKYGNRNVLVEPSDVDSEFMLGCYKAIEKDKGLGNPSIFIVQQGTFAVINMMRKKIRQGIQGECQDCYSKNIKFRRGRLYCGVCDSTFLDTHMVENSPPEVVESDDVHAFFDRYSSIDEDGAWEVAVFGVVVEELRSTLNGRVLELFDKVVVDGYDRDSCRNYLAEIASEWGVSPQAVNLYMKKLRVRVREYFMTEIQEAESKMQLN